MKQSGDTVKINNNSYTLGKCLGFGTEGAVYDVVELPKYVIKLLDESKMSETTKRDAYNRLKWLKQNIGTNPVLKNNLAMPKELVIEDLGYIMGKTSNHQPLNHYLIYPKNENEFIDWLQNNYRLKKRLQIATSMFRILEQIHISGLIFTDLSPKNIMVHNEDNNLVFIDTDNLRKKDDVYIGVFGTDGYMAPEIYQSINESLKEKCERQGILIKDDMIHKAGKISVDSDVFSAAIIAFELLTLQHPFVGDKIEEGTAEEETNARHCKTDYILHEKKTNICESNPFIALFVSNIIVNKTLADLFYKTFVDGKDNPKIRPTAKEFTETFDNVIDLLERCPNCGIERIYENHENKCWCCNTEIPEKILLKIFDEYSVDKRGVLISSITNSNNTNQLIFEGSNTFPISEILLEENEVRYVYLRHLLKTIERGNPYIAITVKNYEVGEAMMQINKTSQITNCQLYNKKNNSYIPVLAGGNGKSFNIHDFDVLFDVSDSRVGKIKAIGRFYLGDHLC